MRSALKKGLTVGSQLREGDCTPVTLAARLGNVEALAFLHETAGRKRAAFWRANAAGLGPLHEAAKRPDTEALRWLLAKSPAPNRLDAGDSSGRTPLHYAASLDRAEAVKLLAEAGAHLSEPAHGCRAKLFDALADARTNHPAQRTPLHASAYLGNAAATAALLDAGAEPHVADNHGGAPTCGSARLAQRRRALFAGVGEGTLECATQRWLLACTSLTHSTPSQIPPRMTRRRRGTRRR